MRTSLRAGRSAWATPNMTTTAMSTTPSFTTRPRDAPDLARRILDAVHAQPRFQVRPEDGRPRGGDVLLERSRRQAHRCVVGHVLRQRGPLPQGNRRSRGPTAPRARFRRAVPARASEAFELATRVAELTPGRSEPHLLRQLRIGGGRHGDEGRAGLPPGARPGRTQHVRVARARVSRRQFRRRVAFGHRQQPPQVRPDAAGHRPHAPHAPQGKLFHARRRRARRRARRRPAALRRLCTARRTSPPASSSRSPVRPACLVPPRVT